MVDFLRNLPDHPRVWTNIVCSGGKRYLEAERDKAIKDFNMAVKGNPDDNLSEIYVEQCEYLRKHPSKWDWDGVRVMTSK